ncbi:hypothetical protein [Actinomadura rupiterrae]|uniref:hypothetical protein n=1 Tax=Actinomadura rupiterrae TaxID=559627 RepID=UPI0020A5BF38|nr:hypothetical protein [Actinomadura rupiterrae]MCP2340598.1 hypothetical protein [Actinomadura rupiterrae]
MIARHVWTIALTTTAAAAASVTTGAWYIGLFTSDGRFTGRDACTLLPPPARLAPLVAAGAREPIDSRPKTVIGLGGDARSECKWSSVPEGQDHPFRTVRIHFEAVTRTGRVSAESRAKTEFQNWRAKGSSPTRPVDIGDGGYTRTDVMTVKVLWSKTDIYDVHAKFRISNALVDVSARTHTEPGADKLALVVALARDIAAELDR